MLHFQRNTAPYGEKEASLTKVKLEAGSTGILTAGMFDAMLGAWQWINYLNGTGSGEEFQLKDVDHPFEGYAMDKTSKPLFDSYYQDERGRFIGPDLCLFIKPKEREFVQKKCESTSTRYVCMRNAATD
ncbi:hypothetical protein CAPTEDRAFT_195861 [Capitella teleta]|uniref:Uncharacterized protein n=1 Tax=Capitella teleta TaxID=283909 RepID=R7UCK9_CAPTE|nr:hypothetical protein CAPTEDRAFT_195861 [Capitella teleta]|eukprot:ELU03734.1 hypothetical protein CAPTEDRAFT_195861 [Capitella teleta]